MQLLKNLSLVLAVSVSQMAFANTQSGKYFDHAIFVLFENTNYSKAMAQPFFGKLAKSGSNFTNFSALTHPSQGNYIALTSGSLNGVKGDGKYDIDSTNIVDLLEKKNLTWKVYVEDYPGNCFTGMASKDYERKHNPFISYINIQKNPARCARIVEASEFDKDVANGTLPNYVFYVPNMKNNGHNTGVTYADKWYGQKFGGYVSNSNFMENTILISSFDESGAGPRNQIYTSIVGSPVRAGDYSAAVSTYSLLKLMEENWDLGDLGRGDASAASVPNIWK